MRLALPKGGAVRAHARGHRKNSSPKGIGITIKEFRESPELVSEMRRILEIETLKTWIETYRNDPLENPVKKSAPIGITPTDAHILLGEQTAWNMCLDRFILGGKGIEPPLKQEEQTYAEPPPEPE